METAAPVIIFAAPAVVGINQGVAARRLMSFVTLLLLRVSGR
jgi:hypothetical protein